MEHPSRVVFTFGKRDKELAELTLDRLNFPELCLLDDRDDVVKSA